MNTKNIEVLVAALIFVFCCTSSVYAVDAGLCDSPWTQPSCEYPQCCYGSYEIPLYNNESSGVRVFVYWELFLCLGSKEFECDDLELPETPDYCGCATDVIPANTDCEDPYKVLFLNLISDPLCACLPNGEPGGDQEGIHMIRVTVCIDCKPGTPPCNDLPGICGDELTFDTCPSSCCELDADYGCIYIENEEPNCCP